MFEWSYEYFSYDGRAKVTLTAKGDLEVNPPVGLTVDLDDGRSLVLRREWPGERDQRWAYEPVTS